MWFVFVSLVVCHTRKKKENRPITLICLCVFLFVGCLSVGARQSSAMSTTVSGNGDPQQNLLHCHACGACGNVQVCLGCHEVYYCNRVCFPFHLRVFLPVFVVVATCLTWMSMHPPTGVPEARLAHAPCLVQNAPEAACIQGGAAHHCRVAPRADSGNRTR